MNTKAGHKFRGVVFLLLFWPYLSQITAAQTPLPAKALTLEDAVNYGLQNYPRVQAALERTLAAQSEVSLAKTAYLPRADMLWQTNRASRNNVFGLLLPQSILSPMSGPVLATTSNDSVWGNAAGLLVSWEPFDFGRRAAAVSARELVATPLTPNWP